MDAYIKAFNTGDEKLFLAANEKTMTPELLAKRPAEERAKLFQRLRGDFATIKSRAWSRRPRRRLSSSRC